MGAELQSGWNLVGLSCQKYNSRSRAYGNRTAASIFAIQRFLYHVQQYAQIFHFETPGAKDPCYTHIFHLCEGITSAAEAKMEFFEGIDHRPPVTLIWLLWPSRQGELSRVTMIPCRKATIVVLQDCLGRRYSNRASHRSPSVALR